MEVKRQSPQMDGTADDQLRARILDAARDLLRRTNSTDLPMRDLVQEAGTNNSAVYRLFGSKSMILRDILLTETALLHERSQTLDSADALDLLFKVVRLSAANYFDSVDFMQVVGRCLFDHSGDVHRAIEEEGKAFWSEFLVLMVEEDFIAPDIGIEVLSEYVLTSHISAIRRQIIFGMSEEMLNAYFGFSVAAACCVWATDKGLARLKALARDFDRELARNV